MGLPDNILRKGIVAVLLPDGRINGTGFFITPDGYILTCYHVIRDIHEAYLFNWDEITGSDSDRFKRVLEWKYNIDWAKKSKIDKINDSAVIVSFENKSITVKINDERTGLRLAFDDGRMDEFILRKESGRLNVYCNLKIKVRISTDKVLEASFIEDRSNKDMNVDFAILKAEGITDATYLPLISHDRDVKGDEWNTVGFQNPLEYKGFPLIGQIVGYAPKNDKVEDIVLHAEININPGSSGSPLVNGKTGKVIGVVKEAIKGRESEGYAISIDEVFKKWPELEKINSQARDVPAFFLKLCEEFSKKEKKILVVGDVMLDHKMEGDLAQYDEVEKHEAGDRVFMLAGKSSESKTLGGAASIARASSEIARVTLIGAIGPDCEGRIMAEICREHNIRFDPVEISKILTTTKIYFYRKPEDQGRPEITRFDREDKEIMEKECNKTEVQENIISKVKVAVDSPVDCIIIKDHGKGFITDDTVREISKITRSKNIPLFIDPKYAWNKFSDKDVKIKAVFPNIKEASYGLYEYKEAKKNEIKDRVKTSRLKNDDYRTLAEKYPGCENFIIKADKNGAVILTRDVKDGIKYKEVKPLILGNEFETGIGCGDTFDSFAITGLLNGHTMEESVLFANFVAGVKAKKDLGEMVSLETIRGELRPDSLQFKNYLEDNKDMAEKIELMLQNNHS